jgi:intracellular sulfur oxidation DsrE/DsrF family protein
MNRVMQVMFVLFLMLGGTTMAYSAESAPWGAANTLDITYKPGKVLYDLTSGDAEHLTSLLDRLGYLYKLYGADPLDSAIVVIIHGDAIPFFAMHKLKNYRGLMVRAQSLTVGTTIEFRMCGAAAKVMGYKPENIHGFVKMVPMADAEIVRLQQEEGYAYMR